MTHLRSRLKAAEWEAMRKSREAMVVLQQLKDMAEREEAHIEEISSLKETLAATHAAHAENIKMLEVQHVVFGGKDGHREFMKIRLTCSRIS